MRSVICQIVYPKDFKVYNHHMSKKPHPPILLIYSRPEKLSHSDTVLYEIYMLRHTALKLAEPKLTERDAWVYLEAFLVHYRNLIEFLGKENPRNTDLHVTNIWRLENLDKPLNMKGLHQQGKQLWQQYEPKKGARISQYLHDCTTRRVEPKDWPVSTMMKDIEPLLRDVEKYLRKKRSALEPIPPVKDLTYFSASTTTMTSTSPLLTQPEKLFVKIPKDFE